MYIYIASIPFSTFSTPTWHNDSYKSISPQRPELSAVRKTGSGIGRETAVAFANAKASRLVLLGRTLASADIKDWWQAFETNTKGGFLGIKVFLLTANTSHATVLALTTGMAGLPSSMLPGLSGYMASKLAQIKIMEFLASEQPNIFAATVHPGLVETDIFTKSGRTTDSLPMDKGSEEARFLNGRSVWANWDVEELKAKASTIQSGTLMTSGIVGWPYSTL
ncbi:short chain dehydrogenase [Hypoxylon sp. NC1633]|nr:short chain dehydrogenase [Hypoxylon sp. NC1633]